MSGIMNDIIFKNKNLKFKNPVVLASMSGITNFEYAIEHAYDAGFIILGSYNIDEETKNAGLKTYNEGRTEFLYENPISKIIDEIDKFRKEWANKNKRLENKCPVIGISIRSKSIDSIIKLASIIVTKNVILELDCHCRQHYYLELGLGQEQINNYDHLNNVITLLKKTGIILSIKIRCISTNLNKFINFINKTDIDIIHVDTMSLNSKYGNPDYIKILKNKTINKIIIANNSIRSFEDAKQYLSNGADLISIARASNDNSTITKIVEDYEKYIKKFGWYNAPNHICRGGDNRGLTFCCPPIKNCNLITKLKELNISPEKYKLLKLKYSKGTPLELNVNTCFGSLMWCCKITKQCYYRDEAIDALKLKKEEYLEYKKQLAESIIQDIFINND